MKILKRQFKTKRSACILWILSMILSFFIAELFNTNNILSINFIRIIFNLIIIFFVNIFIYSLVGKIKLSSIISNVLIFSLSISNYLVYCFRGTPLDPLDILTIETGITVVGTYKITIGFFFISAIILFALSIFLSFKIKYNPKINKKTLLIRCVMLTSTVLFAFIIFNTGLINKLNLSTNLWIPKIEYNENGFIVSFVKQTVASVKKAPDNYSEETINAITNDYYIEDLQTNTLENTKKPNIIVIMNESFSDMSIHRQFSTSIDYLPYYRKFSQTTIHGNLHSSVYGGKTPNVEWEFLTNNSMAFYAYGVIPYQQYIHTSSYSLVSTLEAQGYTSYAVHPYYGSGYRRTNVYPLFGFDYFYALEDMENELEYIREYASDLSTYKKVINLFENKSEDELFFNFTVTMQNHSGYDYEDYGPTVTLTDIPDCPKAEQYLSLVKESDSALEYLINYFSSIEEPTIILMFGDHQPPYIEQEFWDYLNEFKTDSLEDSELGYLTPYFIWANYDIDVEKYQKNDISVNYLSSLLLDVAGLAKTPYMNFLNNMQKSIPVITGHGYIDNHGIYHTFEEETEYKALIKEYEILQYNNVFDNNKKVDQFFSIQAK